MLLLLHGVQGQYSIASEIHHNQLKRNRTFQMATLSCLQI